MTNLKPFPKRKEIHMTYDISHLPPTECVSSVISQILRDRRVRCLLGGDGGGQYYFSFRIRAERIETVEIFQKVTQNMRYLRGCEFPPTNLKS